MIYRLVARLKAAWKSRNKNIYDTFTGDVFIWLGYVADAPPEIMNGEVYRIRAKLIDMDGLGPSQCYDELRKWFHRGGDAL